MEKQANKILLICSDSNSVINFRKELILFLKQKGEEVFLIVGDHNRDEDISKLGINVNYVAFDNRTKNPFKLLKLKKEFTKVISDIKPDIVFTFQIKANIVGTTSSHKAGVNNIFNMVEGLGDPFQPKNIKQKLLLRLICFMYKKSLRYSTRVFFLNEYDKSEFIKRKICKNNQSVVIDGIGIDTKEFVPTESLPNNKTVICLSRLIINKGIFEYCKLAEIVRKKRPDIVFELYGQESQISEQDLKPYTDKNIIKYCGFVHDVVPIINNARLICSTSYREGFPRIILEAMALKRITIASNVIGNKNVITDGYNGILAPLDNLNVFADTLIKTIDDTNLLIKMGDSARQTCIDTFDSKIINSKIYNILINKN